MISVHHTSTAAALGDLSGFREAFHECLIARADALFELTDAALCADGPVTSLVELSLEPEHRRGHSSLYEGLNQGRIDIDRFRNVVARQSIPRCDDGRIMLAIDVSNRLRPDANTSPERLFCHTCARGRGQAQMIPGWPYSFVAALEPGRTSWKTCDVPGNDARSHPPGCPPPGSDGDFAPFARQPHCPPAHRNPPGPGPPTGSRNAHRARQHDPQDPKNGHQGLKHK